MLADNRDLSRIEAGLQAQMTKPIPPVAMEKLVMPLIRQRVVMGATKR